MRNAVVAGQDRRKRAVRGVAQLAQVVQARGRLQASGGQLRAQARKRAGGDVRGRDPESAGEQAQGLGANAAGRVQHLVPGSHARIAQHAGEDFALALDGALPVLEDEVVERCELVVEVGLHGVSACTRVVGIARDNAG